MCVPLYTSSEYCIVCSSPPPNVLTTPGHSATSSTKSPSQLLDTDCPDFLPGLCSRSNTPDLDYLCFTFAASFRRFYLPRRSTVNSTVSFPTELYVHRVLEKCPPRPLANPRNSADRGEALWSLFSSEFPTESESTLDRVENAEAHSIPLLF